MAACVVNAKMPSAMKPKCEIDVYDTSRFMSLCPMASSAAYSTPTTASTSTSGAKYREASGNSGRQ